MDHNLLGKYVHFPNFDNVLPGGEPYYQGEIVAVRVDAERYKRSSGDEIEVTVLCTDNRFRAVYLENCINGSAPKPEDEE